MRILIYGLALCWTMNVWSASVSVAVAANFAGTLAQLHPHFEKFSGHQLQISSGASGKFYAQIRQGAPYDVLLSADTETPGRLEREGLTVPGSRFTYAIGRLVLWSGQIGRVDDGGKVLSDPNLHHVAMANPALAPYGRAAQEVIIARKLDAILHKKIVMGENIAQTYQFVASGNADLGFVALSQVMHDGKLERGSAWIVPAELHAPIQQDAVLLRHGGDSAAAKALLEFLRSQAVREHLTSVGYQ